MSFTEWFRPPFSLFFLWAVFLTTLVLFQPVRQFVRRTCHYYGITCCGTGNEEESLSATTSNNAEESRDSNGAYYGNLSPTRMLEIDNLRSRALLQHLKEFTLTLNEQYMTRLSTDSEQERGMETRSKEVLVPACKEGNSCTINDDNSLEQTELGEQRLGYTHILIPSPGWKDEREVHSSADTVCIPVTNESESEKKQVVRTAPVFCAICLMEYEMSERVCWSPNVECSHVFHQDCIIHWLVSAGRIKSKRQWCPENPSERNLLSYALECPCCRQDFILESSISATDTKD